MLPEFTEPKKGKSSGASYNSVYRLSIDVPMHEYFSKPEYILFNIYINKVLVLCQTEEEQISSFMESEDLGNDRFLSRTLAKSQC